MPSTVDVIVLATLQHEGLVRFLPAFTIKVPDNAERDSVTRVVRSIVDPFRLAFEGQYTAFNADMTIDFQESWRNNER